MKTKGRWGIVQKGHGISGGTYFPVNDFSFLGEISQCLGEGFLSYYLGFFMLTCLGELFAEIKKMTEAGCYEKVLKKFRPVNTVLDNIYEQN